MIKNIVFDMGNVLLRYDPLKVARHFSKDEKAVDLMKRELFEAAEWALLDRGELTEEEALRRVEERIPGEAEKKLARACMENWHLYNMEPVQGMEELTRELREKGFRLYILSNASLRFRSYQDRIPGFSQMEGSLVSAEERCLKPEPEIYRRLFEKFSLLPQESFFIDDLQENIDGARACGMDGYCFADRDVKKLRQRLDRLNQDERPACEP